MNEELSEYNYDQNPEKPKRGIAKSKRRKNRLGKWGIGIVVLLIVIVGVLVWRSSSQSTQEPNMSELARAINSGNIDGLVLDGDELKIFYKNGDEATTPIRENIDNLPQTLLTLGANDEALADIRISYVDKPAIDLGYYFPFLYVLHFIIVFLILFELPKRVEDDRTRIIWAAIMLFVPILGPIAFMLLTRPQPMRPASSVS